MKKLQKLVMIGTTNIDKFEVVVGLLKSIGLDDHHFVRPDDYDIPFDIAEHGTLQDRARLKANAIHKICNEEQSQFSNVALYVGVDDGIRINKERKTYVDSKKATDYILESNGLKEKDGVTIVRAFCFIANNGKTVSCTAKVPLVFLGNPKKITRTDGTYPLSSVLAYQRSNVSVADLDKKLVEQYNRVYMQESVSNAVAKLLR